MVVLGIRNIMFVCIKGGNCGVTCSVDALRDAGLDMDGFKDPFSPLTNSRPRSPIDW
jgi:hypothetical protein